LQLHLELAGGLTGDMFLAAVLDAFPQFEERVAVSIDAVEEVRPVVRAFDIHSGHVRKLPFAFSVITGDDRSSTEGFNLRSVCDRLSAAPIQSAVRWHSKELFRLLAEAESAAYGVDPADIDFREFGARDAIGDIVGAATLIDALDHARWSASPVLVPEGMTPTGTAILRYLCPRGGCSAPKQYALVGSGTGFPSRSPFPCNPVRVLCFDEGADSKGPQTRPDRAHWPGDILPIDSLRN
jgi:pyridinium-3,5-bisthiocarboxylic acid mononucleotide nickel chelatase